MLFSTRVRALAVVCFAAVAAAIGRPAFADSYDIYAVSAHNSGQIDNIGLTDSGTLTTLTVPTLTYTTFSPPSTYTTSPTLPAFTFDNGSACTPSVSGMTGVSMGKCNNGREVFEAYSASSTLPSFYLLENGMPLQLLYSGAVSNVLLDAMGDVAFVGLDLRDADTNFLYYDSSSRAAVTPEPSSLVLLLTGGLGTAAAWRRRGRRAQPTL